jgi:hypothetical protein
LVVISVRNGTENASVGAFQLFNGNAGILKGLVSHLEHESLLRVHGFGFNTADAKKVTIKNSRVLLKEMNASSVGLKNGPMSAIDASTTVEATV